MSCLSLLAGLCCTSIFGAVVTANFHPSGVGVLVDNWLIERADWNDLTFQVGARWEERHWTHLSGTELTLSYSGDSRGQLGTHWNFYPQRAWIGARDGGEATLVLNRIPFTDTGYFLIIYLGGGSGARGWVACEYRVKLLHNFPGGLGKWDCGYAGFDLLPDGTFVATTYLKYSDGPELHSIVSTRFRMEELDALLGADETIIHTLRDIIE